MAAARHSAGGSRDFVPAVCDKHFTVRRPLAQFLGDVGWISSNSLDPELIPSRWSSTSSGPGAPKFTRSPAQTFRVWFPSCRRRSHTIMKCPGILLHPPRGGGGQYPERCGCAGPLGGAIRWSEFRPREPETPTEN